VRSHTFSWLNQQQKSLAVLVDPDKYHGPYALGLNRALSIARPDVVLVGGSTLLRDSLDEVILKIKSVYNGPIVLFPGSGYQLSEHADGILVLSLISGRNPDLLIGKHVEAAGLIRHMDLDTMSCGYVLIEDKKTSSVQYMSQTAPIPRDKPAILRATAMAGELLGLRSLYLEAGSGATAPIPTSLVESLRTNISLPIIVGGGIRSVQELSDLYDAGANTCVIGTLFEQGPDAIVNMVIRIKDRYKRHIV